jgi:hypothetical protein
MASTPRLSYDLLCGIAHAEGLLKLCSFQPRPEHTAGSRPFRDYDHRSLVGVRVGVWAPPPNTREAVPNLSETASDLSFNRSG